MPRGTARTIATWLALIWVCSFVLACIVLLPSILTIRNTAADVRSALAAHDYSAAADSAASFTTPSDACRLSLLLPAPLTLRAVPGVSPYMQALQLGCEAVYGVAVASDTDTVRAVAARLTAAPSLRSLTVDGTLAEQALAALDNASPYIANGLNQLQQLDALGLGGSWGSQIHALAVKWTPARFRDVQALAAVAPSLLGIDQTRTYFVALESNAEMRATGGFIGQYAIVQVSGGSVKILHVGPNTELVQPATSGVTLLKGTAVVTQTENPMWVNTNLSPHGPDVGALWLDGWKQTTGQQLDGAIGIDITTAARLAAAAGGTLTKPDGTVLSSAAEISAYAQNGVYFDFDGPDKSGDPRKAYQLAALRTLLQHASASMLNIGSLWDVLPGVIAENRVLITFADPALQARIASSPVAHDLTQHSEDVVVAWNNWSGNKFDYYMQVAGSAKCTASGADLLFDVRSTALAGKHYPAYIGQRLDAPAETRASVRDQFLFVLPVGADVRWLSVDGRIAQYQVTLLGDRPVAQLLLDTMAGQRHVVRMGVGGSAVSSVQVQGARAVAVGCR